MTTRILPVAEWPRLAGTEAETVWPYLNPTGARVIVVEDDDGQIIGTWVLMTQVHVECLWIAPSHRGTFGVSKRLLRKMRAEVSEMGARSVITGAENDQIRDFIVRLGGERLPTDSYLLPVLHEANVCQLS